MKELTERHLRDIRSGPDKYNWNYISCNFILTEDFIREFQDKVNWQRICYYQKLSEPFIKEFKENVEWYWISEYQTLSESFLLEFIDKISLNSFKYNNQIPEDVKNRIIMLKELKS